MSEVVPEANDSGPSDDELIGAVRDPASPRELRHEALEALFERHHARVREQCRRLLGDTELADDATQDIFLALMERTRRYDARRHFTSWLYIVVRNHCFNLRRSRRRETQGDATDLWMRELVDDADPQREAQQNETAALLDRICEERLNPREREVVHLRYVWGLRVKQINELLELDSASGARSHLATATRKLREALTQALGADAMDAILEEE